MSTEQRIDGFAARLGDPSIDTKVKVSIATDLRDTIDLLCNGPAYPIFLKKLVPVFMRLLEGPPVFTSISVEQRLRSCVLEILHRLPMRPTEVLKPYAAIIVDVLMGLAKVENEDNAVLCMKTIMDLERHQTETLASKVQPFLDLIQEMFETMDQVVRDTFDNPIQAAGSTPGNSQSVSTYPRPGSPSAAVTADLPIDQQAARPLLKGMQSFKVLAECPIIVVSIFQAYRSFVHNNVKKFVPLIKGVLLHQAEPQKRAHAEAKARNESFTGVSKDIKNRAAFGEFITAQVKTMSFLAYLLRIYSQQLTDFLPALPDIVVRLLQDCPSERSATRKELLVAIRHIVNFNFRKIFLSKIDDLLDERTLIGDGLTVYETMRPLAYSMLADLIHHVRDALDREQIRRTVEVFSKNLHDDFPGTSFQTMSAKLLLNMAERIAKPDSLSKEDARYFLIMILNAIGDKFAAMNRQYHNAVKLSKLYHQQPVDSSPEDHLPNKDHPPDWDEIDIFTATPIKTSNPRDRGADPVEDNRFLFKNLMNGLKNMFYQLKVCNPQAQPVDPLNAPANWDEVSFGYNAEEVEVIIKLFREGSNVFRYYSLEQPPTETHYTSPVELLANHYMVQSSKEEKDLLETFATVFHAIDPATFHEVFHTEIPHLYEMMFEHTALLHIPQFFLASEATSPAFAGMLLQFLMDHLDDVGSSNIKKSSILLRMFKLSFMAVTLFSQQNEQVLLPHVSIIITKSIRLSTTAEEPINYFLLLRSLFRSIGGGRFELLYKDILPLLEMLLEVLNNLLMSARKPTERDLYVELCLTVPARLSNLLPHLSYLMRPLVVALRAGSELVGQGLRTLELCVDNLTAEYLDPIMAPVIDELMTALWEHLRPNPYSHFHSHTTMRILGKLGGRNRRFLNNPPSLQYHQYADDESSIDVKLVESNRERAFPVNIGVDLAIAKLMDSPKLPAAKKADGFYKQQALRLLSGQLKIHIGSDNLPEDFAQLVRSQTNDIIDGRFESLSNLMEKSERQKSIPKKEFQEETVKKILKAIMFATTIPQLDRAAASLLVDVCRHFTILELGRCLAHPRPGVFNVNAGEGPLFIDSRVLTEAIVESLASDVPGLRECAVQAVKNVYDAAAVIFGSTEKVEKLPFFTHLAKTFCHNCYEEEWYTKAGGGLGINMFATTIDLGDTWMINRQIEFVRALVYIMKDMPQDLPASTRVQAQITLEVLLRRCNKDASKDDLQNHESKLYNLCGFLSSDLSHFNRDVRLAAQKAFTVIAEVLGVEVHEVLAPVKDRLLQPIYNKPLRALPSAIQIGYIEATTFCLSLQHGLVEFVDALNRLLIESLALADADDNTFTDRPLDHQIAEAMVKLRVSCIGLLSMAVSFPEFGGQPQSQTRGKIIAVFFKSLYSRSPEVIEAANAGLKGVLTQTNKLPKDLLQNGLRPILMNLQDPRKMSVAGLDGLARLLTLLTNYFKVEIGQRLLDHMKAIADSPALQKTSFSLIEQDKQMKVVSATLNIFHLLPVAATSFMSELVNRVLDIEDKLRRTHYSPFREPLLKYLNRYPKETWAYFSPRLHELRYGRFFGQLLADQSSTALRNTVIADIDCLLKALSLTEPEKIDVSSINTIHIVHSISIYIGDCLIPQFTLRQAILSSQRDMVRRLKVTNPDAPTSNTVRLAAEQAGEQVMDILITYMCHSPEDLDFLFQLIDAITTEEIKLYPSLFVFLYKHVISSDSVSYRRAIVLRCLDLFTGRVSSQKTKTFLFHNLVNPILAMDIMRTASPTSEQPLLDKGIVEAIHNKCWKPQMTDVTDDNGQPGVDHSRLELLQMSALLLKHHHQLVSDSRKDVIKFGWSFLRLEDIINKHATYVLISYFIAQFDSPAKIINQIYYALLKAHQTEGRALVIQALDLIAPVLTKRLAGPADTKPPTWVKWPKKILAEESSNLQQLVSIFQFMVRHPNLFYEAREHFIPQIIQSLEKIAAPPNPSNESKKLVLKLIEMIWHWEDLRIHGPRLLNNASESPQSKKRVEVNQGSTASPTAERAEYHIPPPLRLMLIKYLAQFITTLPERFPLPALKLRNLPSAQPQAPLPPSDICQKAISLLYDLLSPGYWTDLEIDLFPRVTEPILTSEKTDRTDDKTVTSVINTLLIIRIIAHIKSDDWIVSQIAQLQRYIEKPMRIEDAEIQDCLHTSEGVLDGQRTLRPLVRRILDALPKENIEEEDMEVETPSTEFITFLSAVATEMMSAGRLMSFINILWSLVQVRPSEVEQHIPQVMRALQQKLAKDHLSAQVPGQMAALQGLRAGEGATIDPREVEIHTQLIFKVIDLISLRMATLGEQRRPFLSVLAQLVERSQNVKLCEKILSMVESWIFDSDESWPTLKEKTAVLHKMLIFEQKPDSTMLHEFLKLVIRIYEDPKITRTELTVRLEHAFLIGTRAEDVEMRNRFMNIFDRSLARGASARLIYVLTSQNWDTLADSFWLSQAIQLIFGSIEMGMPAHLHQDDFTLMPASQLFSGKDPRKEDLMLDDRFEDLMASHKRFCSEIGEVKIRDILEPLCQLQHTDPNTAYQIWIALFPLCWSALSRDDRMELEKGMVTLLTRDYHQRQVDRKPNVVQALLEGAVRAKPRFKLPSHVMKYLSKTYDAWYITALALEEHANNPIIDPPSVRESNLDALVEIYAGLQEEDLFYGTWRRRCKFVETNSALSYEQHGMWDKAQQLYEAAQLKARTGAIPFSQGEYLLWEDHWVICAQKLQQWEILGDFAKHENFNDLLLESAWRNLEMWNGPENIESLSQIVRAVSDAPTPRRTFFQAFITLLKAHEKQEGADFTKVCDESIQLCIRKWHQLPKRITNAHVPILQSFQQLVELHDANVICTSLGQTNQNNLDQKSQELKLLLGAWRDRLPNDWDDINAWQDLVTWRQHIFQLINKTYLALLPQQQGPATGNSYAYRGYHETAWIINRFAHTARKHQLPDVCISQLSRIYTLPNIEIQEAFLKLREQAKCHYQNRDELSSGLDVINNTNLNYFSPNQKAEFFTLKGMFLAKLDHKEEANEAFGTALYYDIRLPKAWAEWGFYNDTLYKETNDPARGNAAVSCYLEAAGLFKNAKSRKLLSRILWLLSLDDPENQIAKAFEDFKGDAPVWYWITFIPQLLTSLSHREARLSRTILLRIAMSYPQALYFLLRTNREDMSAIKKQQDQQERMKKLKSSPAIKQGSPENVPNGLPQGQSRPSTASGEATQNGTDKGASGSPKREPNVQNGNEQEMEQATTPKKPWEYSDEIMTALKTSFPLLALTLETTVDQIQKHFKCPPDEDAYRLIVALLNDGLSYIGRTPTAYAQEFKLPPATEANIRKFAETILPAHIRPSFEEDFVAKKPTMYEYIHKLRRWRNKFEEKLDRRPKSQSLELFSPHLSEFRFQKFDEVQIPGQYLQHRDKDDGFIRIERFLPDVDLVRTVGFSHRRLKIRGHDGSVHPFAVQHPAARHCRREERIHQLFRIFNGILDKQKESRRRNLNFFLPLMIPLAPAIRLVQDDASYISLQGIYEDYCRRQGTDKDEPVLYTMEKMRAMTDRNNKTLDQAHHLKMEAFTAIQAKQVPSNIALSYFTSTHPAYADFFLFRRQFSYQLATLTFITYTMHMANRYPHKLTIARATGNIWGSELVPQIQVNRALLHNPEPVPFRLTPNLQTLMGPLATEGIFSSTMMVIARCLSEPESELEQQLSLFVRDEMIFWFTVNQSRGQPGQQESQLRDTVLTNSNLIIKRVVSMTQGPDGPLPANQTVIDLVSRAVNPFSLAQSEALWMPYL